MSSILDEALRETMNSFNFFSALQSGGTKLISFVKGWSNFHDDISTHQDTLNRETLIAAQNYASFIEKVTLGVMDLKTSSQSLFEDSTVDLAKVIEDGMVSLSINDSSRPRNTLPAYIEPSYTWLRQNLHNPYPSKEIKKRIARETKSSIKDIDSWFTDTRKRIGWNKLRKDHFFNKQEKIIAASTRFFKPQRSSFNDSLSTSLISEMSTEDKFRPHFLAMARKTNSLYPGRFPALSHLASQPSLSDNASFDSASYPEDHSDCGPQSRYRAVSYPTPEPSPSHSTVSSPSSDLELVPASHLSQPMTKKRRHSSSNEIEHGARSPSSKRIRLEDSIPGQNVVCGESILPEKSIEDNEDCPSSPVADSPNFDNTQGNKRKRRLSDGESRRPSKRPHNALCAPRLHTVSDPLPLPRPQVQDPLTGWCDSARDLSDAIPVPTNAEDLTFQAGPVAIDLYRYEFSPYNEGLSLPETSSSAFLETLEHIASPPLFPGLDLSSFESFDYCIQGSGSVDPTNIQFELLPTPSCQLDYQADSLDVANDSTIFENFDLCSIPTDTIPDNTTSLCDRYFLNHHSVPSSNKGPVLGNFNYTLATDISGRGVQEQEAKRARAQVLREELAQLVAEGL